MEGGGGRAALRSWNFPGQGDGRVVFRALQTNSLPLSGRRMGRRRVSAWTLWSVCVGGGGRHMLRLGVMGQDGS